MSWYIKALKNILNFQGRARRKEYWYFYLFTVIISAILVYFLFNSLFGSIDMDTWGDETPSEAELQEMMGLSGIPLIILNVFIFSHSMAMLSVTVRRLHDTDKSAWWLILSFIPIAQLVLFVLMMYPSTYGSNRYGPCPLEGYGEDDEFDDEHDDYADDGYDESPQPNRGGRPAAVARPQNKFNDRHAPISDEGLGYSDRFNTHHSDLDQAQLDRFGVLPPPPEEEEAENNGSSLDYIEFTPTAKPSAPEAGLGYQAPIKTDTPEYDEKYRRLGMLAEEGGFSFEEEPPVAFKPAPPAVQSQGSASKNQEFAAPRNISSIEAETGISERFGLVDHAPQTSATAPAVKRPRYISALPQAGQASPTAPSAGVQRPIARPASTASAAAQHPGIRPAGTPQPVRRPATDSAFGLPATNPAMQRSEFEDAAFPDFEPTKQLRPAAPAAINPAITTRPYIRPASTGAAQQPRTQMPPRASTGMPQNAPSPQRSPQSGQPAAVRSSTQYSNPLAHSGNDTLGRAKAGLKPATPGRAPSRRGAEQEDDSPKSIWDKFRPKK